jgi:polyvinyl alcohol dehydrogenase (cytochrome)
LSAGSFDSNKARRVKRSVASHALYVPDWGGYLYRINTDTGQNVWARPMTDYGLPAGTISRTMPAISGTTSIATARAYLSEHQNGGLVVCRGCSHRKPAVEGPARFQSRRTSYDLADCSPGHGVLGVSSKEESLIAPAFRGSVQAYSLATGALVWQTFTVPQGYSGDLHGPALRSWIPNAGRCMSRQETTTQCLRAFSRVN